MLLSIYVKAYFTSMYLLGQSVNVPQSTDMGRINFFNVQQAIVVLLYKNTWTAIAQSV